FSSDVSSLGSSACTLRPINSCLFFFFFNDPATTEIYTLSLHDALPISSHRALPSESLECRSSAVPLLVESKRASAEKGAWTARADRKSTRLNSSHDQISYAVFCLKKKKKKKN